MHNDDRTEYINALNDTCKSLADFYVIGKLLDDLLRQKKISRSEYETLNEGFDDNELVSWTDD